MNTCSTQRLALSTREVAQTYGINEGTLANLRWLKQGPKYYRCGRRILYRPDDVEQWLFSTPVANSNPLEEAVGNDHESK